MNDNNIQYKIKSASAQEIYAHLCSCEENFLRALEHRVNLKDYSRKIFNKAVTFEAWKKDQLIGLLAAYLNEKPLGYITNISVDQDYLQQGIAAQLMEQCLCYAQKEKITSIDLEVSLKNNPAIKLYEKFAFKKMNPQGENLKMTKTFDHHINKETS